MINSPSQPESVIPADDPQRKLTVANPDTAKMRHVSIAGDTYTILVSGAETAGRYCHDFEEMFTLLQGELEFTFRGETSTIRAGSTVNIPPTPPPPQTTKFLGTSRNGRSLSVRGSFGIPNTRSEIMFR